jgi:hypothetical protein
MLLLLGRCWQEKAAEFFHAGFMDGAEAFGGVTNLACLNIPYWANYLIKPKARFSVIGASPDFAHGVNLPDYRPNTPREYLVCFPIEGLDARPNQKSWAIMQTHDAHADMEGSHDAPVEVS